MHSLRLLLLPFSLIYRGVIAIRNILYDNGKLDSFSFSTPIIGIGNLTTGGTGKTPHVEYLIRLLKEKYRVATLSRGYGRKTRGFIMAALPCNTGDIGDEPMQYLSKFNDIMVSVSEDRVEGINRLLKREDHPEVILLDDAYQHRRVKAGLNILLLEYDGIFKTDYLLPAGNLREPKSAIKRADIIIVSKSPAILVPIERKNIQEKINPAPHQHLFFSYIRYGEFVKVFGETGEMQIGANYYMEKRFTILLVTGIANTSGLVEYLRRHTDKLEQIEFSDHHEFTQSDIAKIQETFDNIANPSKIIVTTEKDAMRLRNPDVEKVAKKLPIFFLPIEILIHQDSDTFNQLITDYVRKNQPDSRIHTKKNI